MFNAQFIREYLKEAMEKVRAGDMTPEALHAINQSASKMVRSSLAQLKQAQLRGEQPQIEFLTEDENAWSERMKEIVAKNKG